MSDESDEVRLAVIIGITIVMVWKAIDLFCELFTAYMTSVWKDSPDFAIEILGFMTIQIFFMAIVILYVAGARKRK